MLTQSTLTTLIGGKPALNWNRTIDRALVHRNAIAEVLLTDLACLEPGRFAVAAQWPRAHRVYRPDADGRHDPMLILETIRQIGLALSHFGFGVPYGQIAVMRDIGFELDLDAEPRAVSSVTDIAITVECVDVVLRGEQLRSMNLELELTGDGIAFATGRGSLRWISPSTFRALRARSGVIELHPRQLTNSSHPQPGVASAIRGAEDALLAPQAEPVGRHRVLVPLSHPVYFDHPVDHVPGMLLVDAAWQGVHASLSSPARLRQCQISYPVFTELDGEIWVSWQAADDRIDFTIEQENRVTASGVFRTARP